ncbi:hypothetical protein EVAR_69411_1 [Eumeta japonica]|uniref:Uncharacterized protein n=1 Tax=Eumeta variegata TaxID=151549 RepID=A0A4C1ZE15_EUMVA|nr:hypothetical protein EVAR_69411_1 [Eumeta japonica]
MQIRHKVEFCIATLLPMRIARADITSLPEYHSSSKLELTTNTLIVSKPRCRPVPVHFQSVMTFPLIAPDPKKKTKCTIDKRAKRDGGAVEHGGAWLAARARPPMSRPGPSPAMRVTSRDYELGDSLYRRVIITPAHPLFL